MLTEIYCEAFGNTKRIPFAAGLNIIQGLSDNSIGKTSFLKIIDFAFGGTYYSQTNKDIIKYVGEHDICFCHTFSTSSYYFRRSASSPQKVLCCSDDKYIPIKEMPIDCFCKWLLKSYGLEGTKASFRELVNLYIRVWNKPNKEVNRPLFSYSGQPVHESIIFLIKVFGKYAPISELHEHKKYLEKRARILSNAVNYNLLLLPKAREVKKIKKELADIEEQICKLQNNIGIGSVDNAENINEQHNACLERRSTLLAQQGRIKRELRRCENNLSQIHFCITTSFAQLLEFFPEVNIEKLQEVEGFHRKLCVLLHDELETEKARLEQRIKETDNAIAQNDYEIQMLTGLPTRTNEAMQALLKLVHKQKEMQEQLNLYNDSREDVAAKKTTKEELEKITEEATKEIEALINTKIVEYSRHITTSNAKAPTLRLSPNQYEYGVEDNTGTGKAYTDLILFDLAVLSLTSLPLLIHDSFLFNNIDDVTKQNIIKIYNQFTDKQVFIALDSYLGADNPEIDQILFERTRLVLSKGLPLFGKDWAV